MDQSETKILTIPEVACYLKMSKSKVYNLVAKKEIPHLKFGRNVRIREIDLHGWMAKQVVPLNFDGTHKH